MLILTRKTNESIIIGDDGEGSTKITVQVLSVNGNQIRLGITAPKDIPVHREEIYKKIHGEPVAETKVSSFKKVVPDNVRRPAATQQTAMALAFAEATQSSVPIQTSDGNLPVDK